MKKYYMVHNPTNRGPIKQHDIKESAVTEAQRLASATPGVHFVVLEAIEAYVVEYPAPTKILMED